MNIYLDMIGCRLNQAEIEQMARQFRAQGHTIVGAAGEADLVVINTCSVTSEAASDSRQKIRRAARDGAGEIIVTGCWSTLQPQAAAEMPQVLKVVPNDRKDSLVSDLLDDRPFDPSTGFRHGEQKTNRQPIDSRQAFNLEPLNRVPLPGLRQRTRAFIKVQDGCDNACTFCITTLARGDSRSRPAAEVISDIQAALHGGAQEIVLTGVHLGSWGHDLSAKHLSYLIQQILDETDVPRLRLSSLEPWDLDGDFFSLWSDSRLCPHLHLPLQSGSAATLKRMLRKTSPESFRELVDWARKTIPGVAITTDVIAGFPGETDSEFAETLAFVREIDFSGGHVFTYSARPGTPAARMKEQVPHEVRKQRNHILHAAFDEMSAAYRQRFIGQTLPVLWEASAERNEHGWKIEGLTGNYIRVTASAPEPRWNRVDKVKLSALTAEGISGEIV
jgi:threonylcarbamoyladenosine tRNA methylthiotransferase MtaB